MILRQLVLKNYKQYQSAEIDFRYGLIQISGKNGSGKSTILEAVVYALYGYNVIKTEYIRHNAASDREEVTVMLDFEVKGELYKVIRTLKGKANASDALLYDQSNVLIARQTNAVTQQITNLLNMDINAFVSSVFSRQKELDELTKAKSEERKKLIRKMLGLDRIDLIQKKINEDFRSKEEQAVAIRSSIKSDAEISDISNRLENSTIEKSQCLSKLSEIKIAITNIESKYIESKKQYEKLQELRLKYNSLLSQLSTFKLNLDDIIKDTSKLNLEVQSLQQKKSFISAELQKYQSLESYVDERTQLIEIRVKYLQKQGLIKQLESLNGISESLNAELTSIIKEISETIDINQELANTMIRKQALQMDIERIQESINHLKSIGLNAKAQISLLNTKIEELKSYGQDAKCPICNRPMKDYIEHAYKLYQKDLEYYNDIRNDTLNKYNEKVAESKKLLQDLKAIEDTIINLNQKQALWISKQTQKERLQSEVDSLKIKTEEIKQELSTYHDIQFDFERFEFLNQYIEMHLPTYKRLNDELKYCDTSIPNLNNRIDQNNQKIEHLKQSIAELEVQISEINYSESTYIKAKTDRDSLEIQIANIKKQESEQHIILERKQAEIIHYQSIINDHQEQVARVEALLDESMYLSQLSKLIVNFKSDVLERIKPSISNYASRLYEQVTNGKYEMLEIDEEFNFWLYDAGKRFPISRFSGGEVDLANLCLRIALSRAIADIHGAERIRFMAFDEVLGSQDEERRNAIIHMFLELQNEFEQIYVISHIESIQDVFPHTLIVKKVGQKSVAEWMG